MKSGTLGTLPSWFFENYDFIQNEQLLVNSVNINS